MGLAVRLERMVIMIISVMMSMVMVITMSVLMFCPTLMLQGWLVRGIWSVDRHLCCLSLTSPVAPSTAGCSTSQSPAKMYHVSCYNIHLLDRGSREQMWDEPPGVTWGWKSCRNLSSTRRLWSGREAARLAAGSGFPLDPFLREISLWETFCQILLGDRFLWDSVERKILRRIHETFMCSQ